MNNAMEVITQKDLETVNSLRGGLNTPETYTQLKDIYNKLGYFCDQLKSHGYITEIIKDPRNQGDKFKNLKKYLWSKVYPKEFHSECKDKLAYIVGITDALYFHIKGLKAYEHKKVSTDVSEQTITDIELGDYSILVDSFIRYDKLNRNNFIQVASQMGIGNFKERLSKMNITRNIELLKYKKQIILQGPPGTGKTKKAKQIARELTGRNESLLTIEYINPLGEIKLIGF